MCKKPPRTLFYSLLIFWLSSTPLVHASGFSNVSLYSHAHSLNYSEASAVYQMYRDTWQDAPKANGKYAFSRNRFILGAQVEFKKNLFSIEYIERNDLLVSFSPETAKIFYYQAQDRKLPNDQQFDINLSAQQFAANGLSFGFETAPWHNFRLLTQLSLLNGKTLQEGNINGAVSQSLDANNKKTYQGQGQISYQYSADKILKHNLNQPYGRGFAVDFKLNWQYQAWSANLIVEDAFQYMQWYRLGQKDGGISTENTSTDDSGFIKYKAMFSGSITDEYDYKQQSLSRYSRLELSHSWTNWEVNSGAWHYHQQTFPFIVARHLWQHNQIGLGYEFNSDKVTLDYSYFKNDSKLSLVLGSNSWSPKLAHALEVQFVGQYQF